MARVLHGRGSGSAAEPPGPARRHAAGVTAAGAPEKDLRSARGPRGLIHAGYRSPAAGPGANGPLSPPADDRGKGRRTGRNRTQDQAIQASIPAGRGSQEGFWWGNHDRCDASTLGWATEDETEAM